MTPEKDRVTPEAVWKRRRELLKNAALFSVTATGIGGSLYLLTGRSRPSAPEGGESISDVLARTPKEEAAAADTAPDGEPLGAISKKDFAGGEAPTPFRDVSTYNNFYELGLGKGDPAKNAHALRTRPWAVTIEGEVHKPGIVDMDALLRAFDLEERIYRMRCVEAWSMVIPWLGFPLGKLLQRHQPTSRAKFVAFETLFDPEQMPGQRRRVLDWPYTEGLRLDEALHPLTLLAVGMYGRVLPNQNGAPLRLVVPWKYGFKGIKSIVRIRLTEKMPATSWNLAAPDEYGFFANVNPQVDHPRWSQATERRIGEFTRRKTLPFNGYAEEVAHLYKGMDLRKLY